MNDLKKSILLMSVTASLAAMIGFIVCDSVEAQRAQNTTKDVVIYAPSAKSVLNSNQILKREKFILSPNHKYVLIYQSDGNLVVYGKNVPMWASHTTMLLHDDFAAPKAGYAIMQPDGDFAILDSNGVSQWRLALTSGHKGAHLEIGDDGLLTIRTPDKKILWQSKESEQQRVKYDQINASTTDWKLPQNVNAIVLEESQFSGPRRLRLINIVCKGPNKIYYHTEGNPADSRASDTGEIAPGQKISFSTMATAHCLNRPRVFLTSKYGQTEATVTLGDPQLKK